MTVRIAILLSSFFLGAVAVFIATKDRWNWSKILVGTVVGGVGGSALVYGVIYSRLYYESLSKSQTVFWGVPLDTTKLELRFLKGNPDHVLHTPLSVPPGEAWVYEDEFAKKKPRASTFVVAGSYLIFFRGGKIREVEYFGKDGGTNPPVLGVGYADNFQKIARKIGSPSNVSTSKNGLIRIISYEKYNVFFVLRKNQVISYGIYNKGMGPVRYAEK